MIDDLCFELLIEHELLAKEVAEVKLEALRIMRNGLHGDRKEMFHDALERLETLRQEQAKVSYSQIAEKFELARTTIANLYQRDRW